MTARDIAAAVADALGDAGTDLGYLFGFSSPIQYADSVRRFSSRNFRNARRTQW